MIKRIDWSDYSPQKVKELKEQGDNVFLDINLYDIPDTTEKALKAMKEIGIDYVSAIEEGQKVFKNL